MKVRAREDLGQATPVARVRRRWRLRMAGICAAVVVSEWVSIALAHLLGLT